MLRVKFSILMVADISDNEEAEVDKIFITDLRARGIIGVNAWEREKAQEILINVTLWADLSEAGASDNLEASVNYRTLAKKILAHTEQIERFTVEALAQDLVEICFEDERVEKVKLRVEKPGAVRFSASVGVEIERQRGA